jgi:hypothetical protein
MLTTDGFKQRTASYFHSAAEAAERMYDLDGRWMPGSPPAIVRERYWLSLALYATGKASFADAVIRGGNAEIARLAASRPNRSTFDIFHSNIAVMCLKLYHDVMADDVRSMLADLVTEAIKVGGSDRSPEYQFHGYNDNMPAKAAMGLVLGGELLGDETAVAHGVANLRGLRAMLVRRGAISEYNSPTYCAVTLHALAEIAEHSESDEARELAGLSEARLWLDMGARFHPEIGCLAGPYSRAYTIDLLATVTCVSSLLWFVLGDIVKASPMLLFENDPALVVHHAADYPFNIAQMSWFASGSYHVPDRSLRMFESKPYPFSASATYEMGNVSPDYPARSDMITTYLHQDYTLGTAGTGWLTGEQCAPYFVTFKQQRDVRSYRDVGTVFTKLVLNDDMPGTVAPTACAKSGEEDNLKSYSGCKTVQWESTALVRSLAAPQDAVSAGGAMIARLSELVIFPCHHAQAAEIMVGGESRRAWDGTVAPGEWIACRRGRLLIAILPLAYSRDFGQAPVTLDKCNNYQVIRATFYSGCPRTFTRDELRHVFGGFVAEHASVDDYKSLAEFAESLRTSTVITDYLYTTRRTRYTRSATTQMPALDIETSWSPAASTMRFAAINGRVIDHRRLSIDGVAGAEIPFFTDS